MSTGYIQTNILGRARGLKFGTLAAENIMSDLVALGVATGGNYSSAMICSIIYWGLYNNCHVKREILDVSFEQVSDWVDDNFTDPEQAKVMEDIVRTYEDSKGSKFVLSQLETTVDNLKKKMAQISQQQKGGSS